MIQGDRGVDDSFLPRHKLYFRITKEDYIDGRLIDSRIAIVNQSVNWSKYSKPWDVKFDHPKCGIAQILVVDIKTKLPETLIDPKDKYHYYGPKHVPESLNYSHSEIQVHKDDVLVANNTKLTSKLVKKAYRALIVSRAVILLEAAA